MTLYHTAEIDTAPNCNSHHSEKGRGHTVNVSNELDHDLK